MAVNRYQKYLYAIELSGKQFRDRIGGVVLNAPGWTRESPRATSPYVTNTDPVSQKVRKSETKENVATPAGAYFERDLHVIHSQIISAPARHTARRRGAGN